MKRGEISTAVVLLLMFLIKPVSAFEIKHAIKSSIGVGDRKSMAVDLSWQQTYGNWLNDAAFELRPFTAIGGLLWVDIGGRHYFWATTETWRKSSHTSWGVFAALGLKLTYKGDSWQPFIAISSGPSHISDYDFVERNLGGHFIFNNRATVGARFGSSMQHELSAQLTHYSNAGIYTHNRGYNTFSLSYVYHF